MGKYIRKARRAELANAGLQMTFDLEAHPGQGTPGSKRQKTERRMMLRTDEFSLMRLNSGVYKPDEPCPVEVINDFISSRRGKKDLGNEHSLFTRYAVLCADLNVRPARHRDGIRARLVTRNYPEGVLVTCHSVVESEKYDPLTFGVMVTRDVPKEGHAK